jgi:hypothetical protein
MGRLTPDAGYQKTAVFCSDPDTDTILDKEILSGVIPENPVIEKGQS